LHITKLQAIQCFPNAFLHILTAEKREMMAARFRLWDNAHNR